MASVGCGAGLGASSVYSLSFADLLLATVMIIRGGRRMAGIAPFRGLMGCELRSLGKNSSNRDFTRQSDFSASIHTTQPVHHP